MLQPAGYMTVSSYDNVKPLKTVATAIRRWGGGGGGGGVGGWGGGGGVVWWGGKGWREGGWREGCIIYIIQYIHNK